MIFLISDTFKEPPLALDNLYTFGPEMMPHFPILSHDANQPQWTTIVSANELQLYPNEKKKEFYLLRWWVTVLLFIRREIRNVNE